MHSLQDSRSKIQDSHKGWIQGLNPLCIYIYIYMYIYIHYITSPKSRNPKLHTKNSKFYCKYQYFCEIGRSWGGGTIYIYIYIHILPTRIWVSTSSYDVEANLAFPTAPTSEAPPTNGLWICPGLDDVLS